MDRNPVRTMKGLVDFWYARELPRSTTLYERPSVAGAPAPIRPLLSAISILRDGRDNCFISPNWYEWGRLVIIINALKARPTPVVLFEVIDYGIASRKSLAGSIYRLFARAVLGPAMRRCVKLLQVMTDAERERFIAIYGLNEDIVRTLPWPLLGWTSQPQKSPPQKDKYVFSSGRAACDWKTILYASRGQKWRLVVVCSKEDLQKVKMYSEGVDVEVHCEITKDEHDRLLAGAAICVVSLLEERKSSGQVRLGAAIELGVPVIASHVDGLNGYLIPNVNALSFKPGDSYTLRNLIDSLLNDGVRSAELKRSALESCNGYNKTEYFRNIDSILLSITGARD